MTKLSKLDTVATVAHEVFKDAGYPRPPRKEDMPMAQALHGEFDMLARILMVISDRLHHNTPSYTFSFDYAFCKKALEYDEIDLCAAVSARTS